MSDNNTKNDENSANKLLSLIINGKPVEAELLLQQDPAVFFEKGQVSSQDSLTIYNVSPWQLVIFLCDADMLEKLRPRMPTDKDSSEQLIAQDAELKGGGADLVKTDRDPTLLSFDEISQFVDKNELDRLGQTMIINYSLLHNKDGIFFYNNDFYYVNRSMENHSITVEAIDPLVKSPEEQSQLNELRASFHTMENNSGRRSSDQEHLLITNTMKHRLERTGLQYELSSIRYQDTQIEFPVIDAYRTYIRLCKEKCSDTIIDDFWIHHIGGEQRKSPMWLRERLCENRPVIPLPDFKESPFVRNTEFWNVVTHVDESILSSSPDAGLGVDYALFKAGARRPSAEGGAAGGPWGAPAAAARLDFAAIRKLIDMGIKDVTELREKLVVQAKEMLSKQD